MSSVATRSRREVVLLRAGTVCPGETDDPHGARRRYVDSRGVLSRVGEEVGDATHEPQVEALASQTEVRGAHVTGLGPRLAALAEQVRRICRHSSPPLPPCPTGFAALDSALAGGLARGAIHEFLAPGGAAAAHSLALLTAARAAGRQRWVFYIDTARDFYPPAAAQAGVALERLLVLRARRMADALWVCEQVLRCRSAAAVVFPLRRIEAQATRRLQLAAEAGGGLGLLIRPESSREPTFAATRLRCDALRGETFARDVQITVLKRRDGPPLGPIVVSLPDLLSAAVPREALRRRWNHAG